jgi:hypothetical protein
LGRKGAVNLPWWVWIILGLWCGPGIHCTIACLVQKEIGGLTDEGEPIKPVPLSVKIRMFPLLLVLLLAAWPVVVWEEMHEEKRFVKVMKFLLYVVWVLAAWPVLLWQEIRESRR